MGTHRRDRRRRESVARMVRLAALLLGIALAQIHGTQGAAEYFGRYIGPLSRLNHGVSGEVYAVDARTLHIRDFTYDGEGPAAYFYAGNTKAVGPGGFFVRDENGSNGVLKRYNKKHVTVTLPEGKTLHNIKWFSVWCEEFQVNFGDIQIPRGLDVPKPQKISALSGVHAVSSDNIVVVDAQTLLIPSFSYDGEAPDAKFWVGRGPKPSPQGVRVPDENGKTVPLRQYDRKTIVLTLPGDLTIFDIGHFGVWCEAFTVDFGHVQVPPALNVPPSLKMLGVSPQSKLNCEVLSEDLAFEVRWAVAGDSVVIQLVAKLENGEYMSFGLSGEDNHSVMVGGDVVVAWVDQKTLNGYAHDYYLDAKSQCAGTRGSCPDYRIEPNTESVRLLNAALVNGYSIVTYQRPLKAHDGLDKPIWTNQSQPVIWAVGPLNGQREVSYHSVTSKGDVLVDFGRAPKWNCPIPEADNSEAHSSSQHSGDLVQHESMLNTRGPQQSSATEAPVYKTPPPPKSASKKDAWVIPPIECNEPDDGVFYAQMGPTGGKRGYPAITGHVGWGISYYINGLLIPEIYVVRGKTYTFVTEGGMDPGIPAKYHPFYITDDPVGGYMHKTQEEKKKVNIYAGAELNKHGEVVPTGVGRLCNWNPSEDHPSGDDFSSFGAYQRTLTLICDFGEPGVIQWTPDKDTPDTVYYQCFSHRYLGWKIHVLDSCDIPQKGKHSVAQVAASEQVASIANPDWDELQAKPSIVVTTRVKPDFAPQSLSDGFKKDSIPGVKDASFGSKAPVYLPNEQKKDEPKDEFPYEIYKPSSNEFRPNMSDAVIPVKEDFEDLPETTTYKMSVSVNSSTSASTNSASEVPLIRGPLVRNPVMPFRGPGGNFGNFPNFAQVPGGRRPVTVMFRRPVHPMMKPQNQQQFQLMNRPPPMIHHSASQSRPVVVKKPILRLPQRPVIMGPPPPPPVNQRPQIGSILSVPPQPPQPPPMPTRPPKPVYIHKFKKPQNHLVTSVPEKTKYKIYPSQMISQKTEDSTTRMPIAVNTGFNPGSLVIESGFKPIINTPHAEERVSEVEYDDDDDNNEGVIKMDSLDEQKSQTEMFEPMFIPSPLDSAPKHVKKATTEPVKKVRKPFRQVVVRRPVYNNEPAQFRSELDDEEVDTSNRGTALLTEPRKDEIQIPANHKPESEVVNKHGPETEYHLRSVEGDASALPLVAEEPKEPKPLEEEDKTEEVITVMAAELEEIEKENEKEAAKEDSEREKRVAHHESEHENDELPANEHESDSKREKRDAHHEAGHDDHSEHDHQHDHDHDHSMHDHSAHNLTIPKTNSAPYITPCLILLICACVTKLF